MSKSRHRGWNKLAAQIRADHLRKHGAVCLRCKRVRADLECHHIAPINTAPELEMAPSNIEVVCFDCHQKIHEKPVPPDRAEWNALLQGLPTGG